MKKLFSLVAAMIIAATTFAQVDEVTLTVLGTGRTEDEATNIALRSAIEQSFGTFVSANTTILNDQLVRDEIVSVSKGNIKNYDKLAVSSLPNGQVGVSLRATVSINKLISYAKSKGSRAEFAGQAYTANVKLIKLKAESTKKAIDIMLSQMELLVNDMFDFDLTIGEPYRDVVYNLYYDDMAAPVYILPCQIDVYANVASTNFVKIYQNTLQSLNLSEEEIRLCTNNNIAVTTIRNHFTGEDNATVALSEEDKRSFLKEINTMCRDAARRFRIQEIGTKNIFEWKYREKSSSKDYLAIACKANGQSINPELSKKDNFFLMWSNEEKKYLIDSHTFRPASEKSKLTINKWTPNLNEFVVSIRQVPLELTKEQKRAQRNGTYQGKTSKDIMGKQNKLLSLKVDLFKGVDSFSTFKGYELKGVSAPQNK